MNLREKRIQKLCQSYFIEITTTKNPILLDKHKRILVKYGKLTEFNHNTRTASFNIFDNKHYVIEIRN